MVSILIRTAPEGYLTEGAKPIEFEITEDGKIVDLTGTDTSIYNQVKRGDLEGVKIGAGTHQRLAGVPFRITSKTTGESHIIVTDDNGQFSTSSDWASHKNNTNAGKTSEDGIWFGTSEPDDSKGALIYDTYIIEELRCEGNKGFELIPPFEIVVSRNNVTVDLGTLTDEYEKEISIHTTATGKDGEKSIVAGKEVTIIDTVTLDGLEKGTKYQLKGWQMLKEENAELLIDGQCVESDYTFTADSEEMKIEMEYTFNASSLGGQNLVTFEELYDLSNEDEPVKVAEHKDIDDEGQTVLITERIISIHTTATSEDGKKEIEAGKDVTIIDTVTLDGLEIGTKYQIKGWQMIKDENAELIIGGERVENDYTFTADSESMEVQIAFTFDASELGGKELVTFEELYDLSNPDEPTKVTEHINEKTKCVVQMTLTTYDEDLCKKIEPNVSTTKERVEALKKLHDAGIPTVVWLCPILPFINDTEDNIKGILNYCIEAKVYGVICFGMGLTLREGNREYFYSQLDRLFPYLKDKYIQTYGMQYQINSPNNAILMKLFHQICEDNGIVHDNKLIFEYLSEFEEKSKGIQLKLFDDIL